MVRSILLAALCALPLLAGCGGGDDAVDAGPRELLIIGIDSADWSLLGPMIDEGRLPHLAAFREQSASGRMETLVPLTKSPILWASLCTGVRPDVHGIGGFVKGDEQAIVGAADWRAPALWDIAGASGLSTSLLGMWSTHPARDIDGIMVSDFLPYGHGRDRTADRLVTPDSLTADVLALSVNPEELDWSALARFLPEGTLDVAVESFPREMDDLRQIYAADLGYFETAKGLVADHPTDITFFYLRGPDMISHRFWQYMEPDKTTRHIPDREREIFAHVVERYYEFSDELTGEVLSWFPADHPTMILSDHGFWGPRKNGRKGTHEHSKWGICLIRSPLYEAGARFDSLHLYDVSPTILAMLGLPAGTDMPGRVLPDALTDLGRAAVEHLEANRIDTYMALSPVATDDGEVDPAVSDEIRRQLESLGYIN